MIFFFKLSTFYKNIPNFGLFAMSGSSKIADRNIPEGDYNTLLYTWG